MIRGGAGGKYSLAMHSVDLQEDGSGSGLLDRCLNQRLCLDHLGVESGIFDGFNYDGGQLLRFHYDPSGVTHEVNHNVRDSFHFG